MKRDARDRGLPRNSRVDPVTAVFRRLPALDEVDTDVMGADPAVVEPEVATLMDVCAGEIVVEGDAARRPRAVGGGPLVCVGGLGESTGSWPTREGTREPADAVDGAARLDPLERTRRFPGSAVLWDGDAINWFEEGDRLHEGDTIDRWPADATERRGPRAGRERGELLPALALGLLSGFVGLAVALFGIACALRFSGARASMALGCAALTAVVGLALIALARFGPRRAVAWAGDGRSVARGATGPSSSGRRHRRQGLRDHR